MRFPQVVPSPSPVVTFSQLYLPPPVSELTGISGMGGKLQSLEKRQHDIDDVITSTNVDFFFTNNTLRVIFELNFDQMQ